MRKITWLIAGLALTVWAQDQTKFVQAELLNTVKVKKAKVGDQVKAKMAGGAVVLGQVRKVEANSIAISFDTLEEDGKKSPHPMSIRAAMLPGGATAPTVAQVGSVIGMPGVKLEIDESPQHASRFVSDTKDFQLKQGLLLMLSPAP